MKIKINIPGIPKNREEHFLGVLISCLDTMDAILRREKRSSYLLHFIEERLNKVERREFHTFLVKLVSSISNRGPKMESLSEEISRDYSVDFFNIINSFGKISNSARNSHQVPEAGTIIPRDFLKRRKNNESK